MQSAFSAVTADFYEAVGVIGFVVYVVNYMLLTFEKICSEHITFFVLNWIAASCVLVGLSESFNLASALIQVFWILVSTVAIFIRLRRSWSSEVAP